MTEETLQTKQDIDKAGLPDPALIAMIRDQVMQELESKEERQKIQRISEREEEVKIHAAYVAKMQQSSEPWVEVIGAVEDTAQGVRIALEWNDAFVNHLKAQGVKGTDDDQVVQHWVTLILRDMAEQMDDQSPEESDFE